ncbi:MAG TPA: HAMP domain-containing sensor histidine kinase [Minicystis sp.]|nr:HAMP domain-containing sensor histidine kinase [Minicystis sp.]
MIHEVLKRVPMFQALGDAQIAELSAIARTRSAAPGEVLFRQDDPGDALYVVLSGVVRLYKVEAGQELELGHEREGGYFGEMSLIDGAPRSAAASAVEATELLLVGRAEYLALLQKSPEMLNDLLLRLTKNLRISNQHRFGLVQEKEQIRAESELERLRSLSQMVAGVAHEINTPLGIIQNAASLVTETLSGGAIDALARDADAKEALADVAAACQLVQRNIAVASRLVTQFKSLSVRQVSDAREEVDVLQAVRETLELYRFKARSAKLAIDVACALGPEERQWNGFPGHLSQVLLNLLTNVDRYAYPDGQGGKVHVEITAADVGKQPGFEITVRDFGRGIPKDDLGKIWDPFFTTGRNKEGTGLGLAIVHNIVTSGLAGSVRVASAVGEGTTFTVAFPRSIPEGAER